MRIWRVAFATALLWAPGALSAPPPVKEDPLGASRALLGELRFEEAAVHLKAALARGGAEPDRVAAMYLLWAEAEASMGREPYAVELFGRALELAPGSLLPSDAPPKVQRPFDQARSRLGGRSLRVQVRSEWLSDGRARTHLDVGDDLHGLARTARLRVPPEGAPSLFSQVPVGEVTWACASPPCAYSVEVLDESGNVLRRLGDAASPLTVDRPALTLFEEPPPAPPTQEPAGGFRRAWPFVVGAAATGVAAGLMGWRFADTQTRLTQATLTRREHLYAEVKALDQQRRGLQIGTVAASVVAVGLGTVAVITW